MASVEGCTASDWERSEWVKSFTSVRRTEIATFDQKPASLARVLHSCFVFWGCLQKAMLRQRLDKPFWVNQWSAFDGFHPHFKLYIPVFSLEAAIWGWEKCQDYNICCQLYGADQSWTYLPCTTLRLVSNYRRLYPLRLSFFLISHLSLFAVLCFMTLYILLLSLLWARSCTYGTLVSTRNELYPLADEHVRFPQYSTRT